MAVDSHVNFGYSTVATAPSPATSGTSLVVAAGQGALFPTPPFNATVWAANAIPVSTNAEIVRVTAISTDTLTITRAQESTSARSIIVGDQIAATITKKTLTDIEAMLAGYTATIGDGASTSITVTHNLNTKDLLVACHLVATPYSAVLVDVDFATVNTATLTFTTAPASNSIRVVIASTASLTDLGVVVGIANGGTGQSTQQTAIDALTGTQSSGKYLRSDGTHATLSSIVAGDVPTLNQNTTGTASNVTGTVAVANGGTGLTAIGSQYQTLQAGASAPAYDAVHLDQAAAVTGVLPVANGGAGWITAFCNAAGADFSTTSTTGATITGLSFAAAASTKYFVQGILYVNSSSTAGLKVAWASSGGSPAGEVTWWGSTNATTASGVATAASGTLDGTAFCAVVGDGIIEFVGIISSGTGTPTISLSLAKVTSGTAICYKGSFLQYRVLGT